MAERDGAAVDVEAIRIDRQLAQTGEHLRGERLVQLHEADVVERQPRQLQRLANRRHGTDAEALRLNAGRGEGDEARQRLQAALLGERRRRDEHRRGAVARLRRVAGGDGAGRVEGRSKLGERLG